jgi:hypothetical protein
MSSSRTSLGLSELNNSSKREKLLCLLLNNLNLLQRIKLVSSPRIDDFNTAVHEILGITRGETSAPRSSNACNHSIKLANRMAGLFTQCAVKPRPLGRGYKAQNML